MKNGLKKIQAKAYNGARTVVISKKMEGGSNMAGGSFGDSASLAAGQKRPMEAANAAAATTTTSTRRQQRRRVSLKAPVAMRDVTAFQKTRQVGEGTYGYVSSC